nr:isochorismatase family protein [Streptomyces hygroscopicus]
MCGSPRRAHRAANSPPPRSSPQAPPGLDPDVLPAGWPQRLGPDDWAVFKPRWGAFSRTCLEELLTELGAHTLVFAGCDVPNTPAAV